MAAGLTTRPTGVEIVNGPTAPTRPWLIVAATQDLTTPSFEPHGRAIVLYMPENPKGAAWLTSKLMGEPFNMQERATPSLSLGQIPPKPIMVPLGMKYIMKYTLKGLLCSQVSEWLNYYINSEHPAVEETWMSWTFVDQEYTTLTILQEAIASFFQEIGWTVTTENWLPIGASSSDPAPPSTPTLDLTEPHLLEELTAADNVMATM